MKNQLQPDDPLRSVLRAWRVEAPVPPRFRENVWRRLEASDAPGTTVWALFWQWLESALARPALAVAYVTVLVTAGLALGFLQGQSHSSRAEAQLAASYLQSIDPYQKTAH